MRPYYTVAEVAEREGVSERRIRFLCDHGRVYHCEKVGNTWLIQINYRIDLKPVGRPRKRPSPWKKVAD
jgi:hypothetical protein